MAAVNSVSGARLGLGALRPRAVLMCGAAEGVALQVACPDPATLHDLLATLHAAGAGESATATFDLLDSSSCHDMDLSPQLPSEAFHASDTSNSPGQIENDSGDGPGSARFASRRLRSKATSPSRQGPQQCQVCNKIFGNASALAKHKLTHSDERKYVCSMCSKAFKRQDHLNGHMLTHRNKKPYECRAEGCGKSYCDARSLRRHAENHHGAPGEAASPGGSSCIQYAPSGSKELSKDGQSSSSESASPVRSKDSPSGSRSSPETTPALNYKPTKTTEPSNSSKSSMNCTQSVASQQSKSQATAAKQPSGQSKQSTGQQGKPQGGQTSSSANQQSPPANGGQKVKSSQSGSQSGSQSSTMKSQESSTGGTSSSSKYSKPGAAQRPPRTWNVQTQQNQQRTSNALRSLPGGLTRFPPEPRPVECNLCHRRFKNIPALNGHMRLHGGYFKKETESKKAEKKEPAGPPLQTASVSVRALIEEKIISRRTAPQVATSTSTSDSTAAAGCSSNGSRVGFVAPAPPPPQSTPQTPTTTNAPVKKPSTPDFLLPATTTATTHKDATLIELLKRGTKVSVRRSASDPGQQPTESMQLSFQQGEFTLTSMSFQSDEGGYFSPTLQNDVYQVQDPAILLQQTSTDSLQFTSTSEQLDDLAALEDYASVTASLQNQPPMQYPVNQQLQAVLNSPLPESLADFSTYHSAVAENNSNAKDVLGFQKEYIMYANSPHVGLSAPSPLPSPLKYHDSPSFTYPTPPASHEAQSPSISQGTIQSLPILSPSANVHTTDSYIEPVISHDVDEVRNTSSPLSAAFFTTTMSSAEEVEEALEEVLPGESLVHGDALDMYNLSNTSPPPQSPICVTPLPSPLSTQQNNVINSPCPQTFLPTGNITFPRQAIQTLQSHMMPNSDDPLLSSSPKDFGSKKKFDFGGYHSYKIISHGPIDLNNPNLTGILVESNGEYKLIQATSNQLPVSWLTGSTHQLIPKENVPQAQTIKDDIKPMPMIIPQQNIHDQNEIVNNEVITTLKVEVEAIKQESLSDVFLSPNSIPASPQRVSRKRPRSETSGIFFQGQHQSRLKINHDDFFTPAPILNPTRVAPGLYNEINPNGIPSNCSHLLDTIKIENEDKRIPRINIGSSFQASIPNRIREDIKFNRDPSYEHLLWDPGINDTLDDNEVRMFMELAMCAAMPVGGHTREHALEVLGQCGGDIHAATLCLMSQAEFSSNCTSERWTPDEVEGFLAGLREHDKDFYKISKQIGTKNSKQCVQFYYFWKKVTKDYKGLYLRSWSPDRIGERLTNQSWSRWSNSGRAIGRSPSTPPSTPATDSGDEFPCKLCGKVFNKVKSRSAHMKSHRPPDADSKRPKMDRCDRAVPLEDKHQASPDNHSKMQQ